MTHDEFKALTLQLGEVINAAYAQKAGGDRRVGFVLCAVYHHVVPDGTEQSHAVGSNLEIESAARLLREHLDGVEETLGLESDAVRGHA